MNHDVVNRDGPDTEQPEQQIALTLSVADVRVLQRALKEHSRFRATEEPTEHDIRISYILFQIKAQLHDQSIVLMPVDFDAAAKNSGSSGAIRLTLSPENIVRAVTLIRLFHGGDYTTLPGAVETSDKILEQMLEIKCAGNNHAALFSLLANIRGASDPEGERADMLFFFSEALINRQYYDLAETAALYAAELDPILPRYYMVAAIACGAQNRKKDTLEYLYEAWVRAALDPLCDDDVLRIIDDYIERMSAATPPVSEPLVS